MSKAKSSLQSVRKLLSSPSLLSKNALRTSIPVPASFHQQKNSFFTFEKSFKPDTTKLSSTQKRQFQSNARLHKVIQFKLADIGEGIKEVEVLKWFIKQGDKIHQFDKVCEVRSDKANVEITSRYDGVVQKLYYKEGETAEVGNPLIDIETAESESAPKPAAKPAAAPAQTQTVAPTPAPSSAFASRDVVEQSIEKVLTTPAVRRIAREYKVDLTKVEPTGKNGRLLKEDLLNYVSGAPQATTTASQPSAQAAPTPIPVTVGEGDRREPIKGITKAMIKTMNAAARVPHLGYCDEIYMDKLMSLRNQLKPVMEQQFKGAKLTFMPFFIKAVSIGLQQYPILNSSVNETETEIIYHAQHNIGIAMDTPQGLLVPNIKDVQKKSIFEIAQELNRLQDLGAQGKLGVNDLKGGTFTLSNIGTIGGTYASPVILLPEVAIGAIGKIQKLPRFNEKNEVIPVSVMNMSWSADHRVVDGATIARFSNIFKSLLENPTNFIAFMK